MAGSKSLLVRDDELDAAKAWVSKRKIEAPEITDLQRAFLKASEEAEAARIAESRVAQGRTRRMRALLAALFVSIVVGVVGWINQSYLKEQMNWFTTMRPYILTQVRPYVLTSAAEQALKPKDFFRECAKECPEMIVVPAGDFLMGSPANEKGHREDESPQHRVHVAKPFAVSKFEVTFEQWDVCVTLGRCAQVSDNGMGRGTQPVINVTWHEARQYVAWFSIMTGQSYRLLSEAEWEYAARSGTDTAYSWGDEIGKGNANCNGCGSRWGQPAPVGSFAANKFGLYDMHGNVWEWVEDCWHDNYVGNPPSDGSAWTTACLDVNDITRRVMRGGSWNVSPQYLRAAQRSRPETAYRSINLGFRVGRTL